MAAEVGVNGFHLLCERIHVAALVPNRPSVIGIVIDNLDKVFIGGTVRVGAGVFHDGTADAVHIDRPGIVERRVLA